MCACFGAPKLAASTFVNEVVLWSPPEISGWLEKKGRPKKKSWRKRFFVLKGNYLFYFKNSKASTPEGVVPLEYALVDIDQEQKDLETTRHTIHVTLHRAYGSYCKESVYEFGSTSQDVQATWVAALKHAAIPRQDLLTELKNAGRLETILSSAEQSAQARKSKVSFFKPEGFKFPVEMEHEDFVPQGDARISIAQNPLNVDSGTPPRVSTYEVSSRSAMEEQISQLGAQQDDLQRMLDRRLSQLPQQDSTDVAMDRRMSQRPPSDAAQPTFERRLTQVPESNQQGQFDRRLSQLPPNDSLQQTLDRRMSQLPSEQATYDLRMSAVPQNPFQPVSEARRMSHVPQGPRESFNFSPHPAKVSFAPPRDNQPPRLSMRSVPEDQHGSPRLSATNLAGIDRLESAVNAAGFEARGGAPTGYDVHRQAYPEPVQGMQYSNQDRTAMFAEEQANSRFQDSRYVEDNNLPSRQGFREESDVLQQSMSPKFPGETQPSGLSRSLTDDQRNLAQRMKAISFAGYNLGLRAISDEYDGGIGHPGSNYSAQAQQADFRSISEDRYREEARLRELLERPLFDSHEADLRSWKSLPPPADNVNQPPSPFPVLDRPGVQEYFGQDVNTPGGLYKQSSVPANLSIGRKGAPPPPPPPLGTRPKPKSLKSAGLAQHPEAKHAQNSGGSFSEDEDTQPRPSDFAFQQKAQVPSPPSARSVDSKVSFEDELKSRLATRRARLDSSVRF